MRRILLLFTFAVLAGTALFVSRGDAKLEATEQIVPGVWFREGDLRNLGHCNNIIIEMKDYLIVVDANFPSGARAALADTKKVSSKPVKYVFDTHHHGDHAYGNSVWTEAGATTLAYKAVTEEMKRNEPAAWQNSAKTRQDVRELNRADGPEPPKQTFDKPKFVLKDSTRTVEFHFFGWAHTRGDGFVYLPKEQILCTGDAVANGPYNYTGDANVVNWPNVVRKAQKLKIKTVLPGHGVPGGPEVLEGQAQYMIALHKAVADAVAKGKKLEELKTVDVPDAVKKWAGPSQANQIKDTYEEITQKKPHGEIKSGK